MERSARKRVQSVTNNQLVCRRGRMELKPKQRGKSRWKVKSRRERDRQKEMGSTQGDRQGERERESYRRETESLGEQRELYIYFFVGGLELELHETKAEQKTSKDHTYKSDQR